jgi:AraC-like DNA-binding protein
MKLDASLVQNLMDALPAAVFWIKDSHLRYVQSNLSMVEFCGADDRADVIGKSARDFFPQPACAYYEEIDQLVMRTGRPIKEKLHLTPPARGRPVWLLYSRWPVLNQGAIVGVASLARVLDAPYGKDQTYQRLKELLDYIDGAMGGKIGVSELAKKANVSVSQLERDFLEIFGSTPMRYLTKLRLETATEMLKKAGTIAEIAHACGYSDQSAFTRRFRSATGMSPVEYRKLYGRIIP